jgi:hypothetical protein
MSKVRNYMLGDGLLHDLTALIGYKTMVRKIGDHQADFPTYEGYFKNVCRTMVRYKSK